MASPSPVRPRISTCCCTSRSSSAWHQQAANALESVLNYRLQEPLDRDGPAYRFTRGADRTDVMSPDHTRPAPLLHRHPKFAVEGGKQALDRTMTLAAEAAPGETLELSVPDGFGALVLNGAAYISDTRGPRPPPVRRRRARRVYHRPRHRTEPSQRRQQTTPRPRDRPARRRSTLTPTKQNALGCSQSVAMSMKITHISSK